MTCHLCLRSRATQADYAASPDGWPGGVCTGDCDPVGPSPRVAGDVPVVLDGAGGAVVCELDEIAAALRAAGWEVRHA